MDGVGGKPAWAWIVRVIFVLLNEGLAVGTSSCFASLFWKVWLPL